MPCLRIQMSLAQQPEDCHRATIELALLLPLYCTQYASLLLDSSSSSSSGCSGLHSITSLCPALTHSCCWPQEYMLLYQQLGDNFPQIKLLPSQSQVPTHAKPQSSRVVSSRLSYSRRSQSEQQQQNLLPGEGSSSRALFETLSSYTYIEAQLRYYFLTQCLKITPKCRI